MRFKRLDVHFEPSPSRSDPYEVPAPVPLTPSSKTGGDFFSVLLLPSVTQPSIPLPIFRNKP